MTNELFSVKPSDSDPRAILLPLGRLDPGENYRTEYANEDVTGLAESMRIMREEGLGLGTGILQAFSARWAPGSVLEDGTIKPDAKAILNLGRTRYKAAFESGLTADDPVPVIIEDINSKVAEKVAFHENIHRADPPDLDTARKLAEMRNNGAKPLTIQQLVEETGKPKHWVQHHLDLLRLKEDTLPLVTSQSGEVAKRINTVEEPIFRQWLIERRLEGAQTDVIDVFLTIRDTARVGDGLYKNLLEWANATWTGAQRRGEKLNPDQLLNALRAEARSYGYALESTGKKFVWRKLVIPTLPVLNEQGEVTGHTPTSALPVNDQPAPPKLELVPSPAEQWRSRTLTLGAPSKTVTVPQYPVREVIQTLTRQTIDLSHALLSFEVVPNADAIVGELALFEEAVQELRDRISTRIPEMEKLTSKG